ncbi:50S ribosomal protein L13 [Candidatus Gottesmanbacteria bacterium CG11_big_fil_rev_8_21_14_0_20_37_11]|uniref:Large ribosomal subunit protein uL13 n=3 Tax=Candidatus Gottesmaniibacteriota TaxID=1752720 RepID=A0A2M7RRX4_9BACT|nr:MAG: 50S ribosomal protein L13 [Candidatus Gottesmanbacteria bacterium CG1_02_37_22]PIP32639.1 MAG: 50S ribosomal protein L13 [Candidatus Gottesmanbacteria bacterium CG23_combo_of_CG06-09_8_20_14_all_37_19]PIR08515.1 MAG: 50S ribosomal protein L13 [Candidatus Gottesmanbacteria bacterium CG11_big_fil_rev_8_21_14_0_20_37_11]PIZ03071.1 MAG: 50S ribosomal protein L13 [Candidatus Gottesmanbacteria bacterium CG_4_10_14_0_8_um_filter_37_24]
MKMTVPTKAKEIKRHWNLVDLKDQILGRAATQIAYKLMGKSKPYYVSNLDCGDYVVVINAKEVNVTGRKRTSKMYQNYSGYPGGLKEINFSELQKKDPLRIINEAVAGMLPKNKIRSLLLKRLYVFSDENHPYKEKLK